VRPPGQGRLVYGNGHSVVANPASIAAIASGRLRRFGRFGELGERHLRREAADAAGPGFEATSRNTPKTLQNGAKTAATGAKLATRCGAWQSQPAEARWSSSSTETRFRASCVSRRSHSLEAERRFCALTTCDAGGSGGEAQSQTENRAGSERRLASQSNAWLRSGRVNPRHDDVIAARSLSDRVVGYFLRPPHRHARRKP
jgi:hypothetical protein